MISDKPVWIRPILYGTLSAYYDGKRIEGHIYDKAQAAGRESPSTSWIPSSGAFWIADGAERVYIVSRDYPDKWKEAALVHVYLEKAEEMEARRPGSLRAAEWELGHVANMAGDAELSLFIHHKIDWLTGAIRHLASRTNGPAVELMGRCMKSQQFLIGRQISMLARLQDASSQAFEQERAARIVEARVRKEALLREMRAEHSATFQIKRAA